MKESADLPAGRPMPDAVRDRVWADIQSRQRAAEARAGMLRAPLTVAAGVVALVILPVFLLPRSSPDEGKHVQAAAGPYSSLVQECLDSDQNVPDAGTWRAGAMIAYDATTTYLAIRTDTEAAACVIEEGRASGLIGGVQSAPYAELTEQRPFDSYNGMNFPTETVHFGIATDDVVAVSLIGPDGSVSEGVVSEGTFIVRSPFGEDSNEPNTNQVRATMADGQTVTGPMRN